MDPRTFSRISMETSLESKNKLSAEEIAHLAEAFWNLCSFSGFTNDDINTVLGKELDGKTIASYREKKKLPESDDNLILRAVHLLAIHHSLQILYPHNENIVKGWMKTKTTEFNGKSPIQVIKESGFQSFMALLSIRRHVEYKRVAA
jgi:hypothetical protein